MATNKKILSTQEVANEFHNLAQQGKWNDIQEHLFSDNAESIEPPHAQGLQTVRGKQAIKEKGKQFEQQIETVHGGYSNEPIVAGNHFAVAMGMDATLKNGERTKMDEIALYEVKDGQIVKEQFFY